MGELAGTSTTLLDSGNAARLPYKIFSRQSFALD